MSFLTPTRGRKGCFRPRLEALEDRSVPAVLGPFCSPAHPGVVVFVATTPAGTATNTLNLFDNGAGVITFNTTTLTGKTTALPAACGPTIHQIIYLASSGTDTLTYNVPKTTALSEHMTVDVLLPASGNKGFTGTFGVPRVPSNLGGPGVAPTPGTPSKPLNVAGELDVVIFGNVRKDNATLTYDGRVNGILNTFYLDPQKSPLPHAHGQEGDKVTFMVNLEPFSTGIVHPKVLGGVGDDNLTLFVTKLRKKDPVKIHAVGALNGGGGMNTGLSAEPVTEVNIQS